MHRLREGEVIRTVSRDQRQANRQQGGPRVFPPLPKAVFEGASGWTTSKHADDFGREASTSFPDATCVFRSRSLRAPDSNLSCRAERSNHRPAALTLLNADEVPPPRRARQARDEGGGSSDERISSRLGSPSGAPSPANLPSQRVPEHRAERILPRPLHLNDFVYGE